MSDVEELRAMARVYPFIGEKLCKAADELERCYKKRELDDEFYSEVHETTVPQLDNALKALKKSLHEVTYD